MDDELKIYETGFTFVLKVLIFFFLIGISLARLFVADTWIDWIVFGLFAVFSTILCVGLVIRSQYRHPAASFSRFGVRAEDGQFYPWDKVTKIYVFTSVLFVWAHSKTTWTIRLDPVEVGYGTLKQVRQFLITHAPPELTEKL